MATRPTEELQWAEDDIVEEKTINGNLENLPNKVEPTQEFLDSGLLYRQNLPRPYLNFYLNLVRRYITYLEERGDEEGFATGVPAATEKTVPVDADLFGIIDSEDYDTLKKLTYANLLAAIASATVTLTNKTLTSPVINSGTLTGSTFKNYKETVQLHGAVGTTETIDLDDGNVHAITLDDDCTLTFSNPAPSGTLSSFTLYVTQDGTGLHTLTYPASVIWSGGFAPATNTGPNTKHVLSFSTLDGGTEWYGFVGGVSFA